MRINRINSAVQNININKVNKKNLKNESKAVTFEGTENLKKAGAIGAAVLAAGLPITANAATTQAQQVEQLGSLYDLQQMNRDGEINTADISLPSLPVTEFYLPNEDGEIILEPNKDLPRNGEGTIFVSITEYAGDDDTEGNTLNEIVEKVYSSALEGYEGEARVAIRNKMIDEIIQANPSLAKFIQDEMGDKARSYKKVGGLDLYKGMTSADDTLDIRLLTIPTKVVYQVQGEKPEGMEFYETSDTYAPKMTSASVIKGSKNLMFGEYETFPEMVYATYGEKLSDEAYRDIVYSIVNAPENASEFEYIIDEMNFNDIIATANIHDLNRTLEENTSGTMIGLTLPTVNTLRVQSDDLKIDDGDRDDTIYQISPAEIKLGQNDRAIILKGKEDNTVAAEKGKIYTLRDALQFYSSPDGNGRFATVEDGELVLNQDVNYVKEFSSQIMQQIVYGNLSIFTAPYEDADGVHPYGVFDVNEGYDIEDKSLEEIIQNSKINLNRMYAYSFTDTQGNLKFEEGTELHLPQFNYRINVAGKKQTTTPAPIVTPAPTPSEEPTPTPTVEPTPTPTVEPTPTPTVEPTPTPTVEPTPTPTIEPTPTPTCDPTPSIEPTEEPEPELPTPSCDPTPSIEPTEEPEPDIPTPTEEPTPSVEPTPTPSVEPLPTPSIDPGEDYEPDEPTPTCDPTPTIEPTEEPEPELPTPGPTPEPTIEPTPEPTCEPTPSAEPSEEPLPDIPTPTVEPTVEPTIEPTIEPTVEPTPEPTVEPTPEPSCGPTPSAEPSEEPLPDIPTPTVEPTVEPTTEPTIEPTVEPTLEPPVEPTPEPTTEPIPEPSCGPTPSAEPSEEPLPDIPSSTPETITKPTVEPTVEPTSEPIVEPTVKPTVEPTITPVPEEKDEPTPSCPDEKENITPTEEDVPNIFAASVQSQPKTAPVEEQPQAAPVQEQPKEAPVEEQPQAAPVQEQPKAAPVEEQPQVAPVQEDQPETVSTTKQNNIPVVEPLVFRQPAGGSTNDIPADEPAPTLASRIVKRMATKENKRESILFKITKVFMHIFARDKMVKPENNNNKMFYNI